MEDETTLAGAAEAYVASATRGGIVKSIGGIIDYRKI